jgi:hypothetical protein
MEFTGVFELEGGQKSQPPNLRRTVRVNGGAQRMKHCQIQLADKPVHRNQSLGDGIDGEKETFKRHSAQQRRTVRRNEAWRSDFVAVQSQSCLRHGPNISLSASDHHALRAGRLQLKLVCQRSGDHAKSSAGVHKELHFFGTPGGTGQTSLYMKQSHFRYLLKTWCIVTRTMNNATAENKGSRPVPQARRVDGGGKILKAPRQ